MRNSNRPRKSPNRKRGYSKRGTPLNVQLEHNPNTFEYKSDIVSSLNKAGLTVQVESKGPTNGKYSGIVGERKRALVIR